MKIHFVRGHCGWDVVTLLLGKEIPEERQLATALAVIDDPVNGGIEAGILEPGDAPGDIRVRITDGLTRRWLTMCGGMTQVIGKALVETSLREHFAIDAAVPQVRVRLFTGACVIPISVDVREGRAYAVTTDMSTYAELLYSIGIEPVGLCGVEALHVGEYLVVRLSALEKAHPGIDFTRRDPGPHLDIVNGVLEAYRHYLGGPPGSCAMLYDDRPEGPGQFRIFPRFSGQEDTAARLPYEFQCGTGTIALVLALAHTRELPFSEGHGTIVIEWGSLRSTPDPYGIRTSRVDIELRAGRVAGAAFSHSVVEIVAEGTIWMSGIRERGAPIRS